MDLKVVFLGVCLCAFAVTYSQAGIPKCCISTKMDVPLRILLKVQRWEIQQSNGACDISAVILHVKNFQKPICVHPKVKKALIRLQRRRRRSHRKDTY
ncbi:C-C motif chemokine 27a [Eucyclogobius newberryi]|uniref:C-C motif chemokine 27a n=1 Tax=Eucyclogobius newberryi TaxID=166745 RepID=UPI003B5B9D1B